MRNLNIVLRLNDRPMVRNKTAISGDEHWNAQGQMAGRTEYEFAVESNQESCFFNSLEQ
ncbi:hypothetical protein P3T25_002465 [Paraburkholderia sp. GAS32]|jgi:hypothetical protein